MDFRLHDFYTAFTTSIYAIHAQYMWRIRRAYVQYMYSTHAVYVQCTCSIRVVYVYYTHTICTCFRHQSVNIKYIVMKRSKHTAVKPQLYIQNVPKVALTRPHLRFKETLPYLHTTTSRKWRQKCYRSAMFNAHFTAPIIDIYIRQCFPERKKQRRWRDFRTPGMWCRALVVQTV